MLLLDAVSPLAATAPTTPVAGAPSSTVLNIVSAAILSIVMAVAWAFIRYLEKRPSQTKSEGEAKSEAKAKPDISLSEATVLHAKVDALTKAVSDVYTIAVQTREATNQVWNQTSSTHRKIGDELVESLEHVRRDLAVLLDRGKR